MASARTLVLSAADHLHRTVTAGPDSAATSPRESVAASSRVTGTSQTQRPARHALLAYLGKRKAALELQTARHKLMGRCKAASASEASLRATVNEILAIGRAT